MSGRGSDEVRVLVNGVSAGVNGGGTYLISQVSALHDVPGIQLTVHAIGDVAVALEEACPEARIVHESARSLPRRLAWEQTALVQRARGHDVVYAVGNFALLASPRPQVVLEQNAILFGNAGRSVRHRFPPRRRARVALEAAAARVSIRRATRVVAVSHSLADAIESDLGPLPKLTVIPSATPALSRARSPARTPEGPYVLVVSHDHPIKDWDGLVEVFVASPDLPRLVVVGGASSERLRRLRAAVDSRSPGRVTFLGAVTDRIALAGLYADASCCLAHSYIEATGLTPLEALSLGVPVAASDIPAHREACGDGAHYYEVSDLGALGQAVREACKDGPAAPRMHNTWEDNATALASILRETARAGYRAGP